MNSIRILIVDDFVMIRSLLKTSLANLGLRNVYEARDGFEAHDKIVTAFKDKNPYHIVFLDWNMPNMNGLELLQKCRAQSEFNSLDFIMMSAEQEAKKVLQALDAGATDFIIKPFTSEDLVKKVEARLLQNKKYTNIERKIG